MEVKWRISHDRRLFPGSGIVNGSGGVFHNQQLNQPPEHVSSSLHRLHFTLQSGLSLRLSSGHILSAKSSLKADVGHGEGCFIALTLTPSRPIKHAHMW